MLFKLDSYISLLSWSSDPSECPPNSPLVIGTSQHSALTWYSLSIYFLLG